MLFWSGSLTVFNRMMLKTDVDETDATGFRAQPPISYFEEPLPSRLRQFN